MKKPTRIVSLIMCIVLILSISSAAYASNNNKYWFSDVKQNHWAYDQIMWMFQNKIIDGMGNNKFEPNSTVTRAQFAKMMVLTLRIELFSPSTPSFLDVKKTDWEYPYVESAKIHLTGFTSAVGDNYRPNQQAVREDMAVALVSALGYKNEPVDENILNKFADAGQISKNLRRHVALAVKYGLIQGYTENGRTLFKPQNSLTRAEAATLLYKAFYDNEDKITYDDEKVTYEDYKAPTVSVSSENNKLVVKWNKIDSDKFRAYAVVISKKDSTPTYPENGHLYYITDKNQISATIDNSIEYNGTCDFGNYLRKGEKYYISVTAVYKDKSVAGNTIKTAYIGPEFSTDYVAPIVKVTEEKEGRLIRWNKIDSDNLLGYRVVASMNDSTPSYPDNGYLYWITNTNQNYAVIDNSTEYKNGDFGSYFTKGQKYYISVTAIYKDKRVTGNTVQFTYRVDENPETYAVPKITVTQENGRHIIRWNNIDSNNLQGYKIVASMNDSTPSYPDNGYLYWIKDKNKDYAVIDNSTKYKSGDFGGYFTKGQKYYISVTAVYNDKNVTSNIVRIKYNDTENPELYKAPVVTSAVENGKLVIRWNKLDSSNLQGYKVVASKNDSTPAYPENGYLLWITDKNRDYAVIDNSIQYNSGDFDKYFTSGEKYYFSVTAVYNDKTVAGNTIYCKYEGQDNPELFPTPVVKAEYENGNMVIKWDKIESTELVEYRVVISQNNQAPVYPANGYYGVYDKDTTSVVLDSTTDYINGDFKNLADGIEYYFSVTAVYSNNKCTEGNAVKKLYLLPPQ